MHRRNAAATVAMMIALIALMGCDQETGRVELEPGLSYMDSVVGQGAEVEVGTYILVHYTGWLQEDGAKGRQFNSSYDTGEPIALPIGMGRMIDGWDRGVPGMRVGGKRTLFISPDLGYGVTGSPPLIPPEAPLIFDVEVLALPTIELEVMTQGDGRAATRGDKLSVDYTGWFWVDGAKGNKFDSSRDRGRPFRLTLGAGSVISGREIALEGMKQGTEARVIIPPSLAYGAAGRASIPPNSTLVFELELVEIVSP